MEVFDVSEAQLERAVAAAAAALDRGQLVVMPTDTVYGVAARPDVPGATRRVFDAKRRPRDLTLPILVSDVPQAEAVAAFDNRARKLAARFWPGALTLVLPRAPASSRWDLGADRGTVGVRIPNHEVAAAILSVTGPLAVTSANISGEPTPPDCEAIRASLGDAVATYLCGRPTPGGVASTVVELTGSDARILRAGELPAGDVLATLE